MTYFCETWGQFRSNYLWKEDSRFKCIYSDINVQVQKYLSKRLPLRPFMISSIGVTMDIIHRLIKNKDIHDIIIIIYIQIYNVVIEHF